MRNRTFVIIFVLVLWRFCVTGTSAQVQEDAAELLRAYLLQDKIVEACDFVQVKLTEEQIDRRAVSPIFNRALGAGLAIMDAL
jgi:hypothetical protein